MTRFRVWHHNQWIDDRPVTDYIAAAICLTIGFTAIAIPFALTEGCAP